MDLTADQIKDLRSLQAVCQPLAGEIVIIGAMAFRAHYGGSRHTYDIDVAVAVDMEGFAKLAFGLKQADWNRDPKQEQRWRSPNGSRFDLLPAGLELRNKGEINWPESELTMNLAGFDHVFLHSEPKEVAPGLTLMVVPPTVLVLLKMGAYLDRPHERRRDLSDIADVFNRYEARSDRMFSDEVYDAGELEYETIGAFLLGKDLRSIALPGDDSLVGSFLQLVLRNADELEAYAVAEDQILRREYRFQQQLRSFQIGFQRQDKS